MARASTTVCPRSCGGDTRRVGEAYAVPGAWRTLRRELTAAPPYLVADDSAGIPYPLAGYPLLRALVGHGYREVAQVRGVRLYRRAVCGPKRGYGTARASAATVPAHRPRVGTGPPWRSP